MSGSEIIGLTVVVFAIALVIQFYQQGRKALSIFPDMGTVNVVYRDRTATGYSTRSWQTRIGGASRSLDVVVTDTELWVRSFLLLAGVAQQHDLIHRVKLSRISRIKEEGQSVTLQFKNDKDQQKQVVINTRSRDDFVKALTGYSKKV